MSSDEPDADEASIVDKPIEPPPGDPFEPIEKEIGEGKEGKSDSAGDKPEQLAKTATAIRKGDGPTRLRRIETRWSSNEHSPNLWFIIASLVFFLAAFGIFLLSMYLR